MLKTLVNKFKSQSLNESELAQSQDSGTRPSDSGTASSEISQTDSDDVFTSINDMEDADSLRQSELSKPAHVTEKGATHAVLRSNLEKSKKRANHNAGHSADFKEQEGMHSDKDSGTESDDEELQLIETISTHSYPVSQTSDYYASQQSLSQTDSDCKTKGQNGSRPTSPNSSLNTANFFNGFNSDDQESNSWDSMGCESGIGLRESDAETPTPTELLYQQNSLRQILLKQPSMQNSQSIIDPTKVAHRNHPHMVLNGFSRHTSVPKSGSVLSGAFRPVPRRQRSLPDPKNVAFAWSTDGAMMTRSKAGSLGSGCEMTLREESQRGRSASTGEKRKWAETAEKEPQPVPWQFRAVTGSAGESERETLTARRTPVKLLISPGLETIKGEDQTEDFPSELSDRCSPTITTVSLSFHSNSRQAATSDNNTLNSGLSSLGGRTTTLYNNNNNNNNNATASSGTATLKIVSSSTIDDDISSSTTTTGLLKVSPRKKCRPDDVMMKEGASENDEDCEQDEEEGQGAWSETQGGGARRPSLNFEKMREKMMKPGTAGENIGAKKHQGFCSAKVGKLRGWTSGYQLRNTRNISGLRSESSRHLDCLFRPVEPPLNGSEGGTDTPHSKTPTGDCSGFASSPPLA